jgi:hypothetical protein
MYWFPALKTKQFPFAAIVSRACDMLTLLPACMRHFGANTSSQSYSDLPKVFQRWPNLSLIFLCVSEFEIMPNVFSLASASNTNCDLKSFIYHCRHLKSELLSQISRYSAYKCPHWHSFGLVIVASARWGWQCAQHLDGNLQEVWSAERKQWIWCYLGDLMNIYTIVTT